MCSPTLAIAGLSAFMQYRQGQAAAKATTVTAANNAKVAEFNAGIQDRAAGDAVARGAEAAAVERQKSIRANATLRANLGGLTDTGTSLQLQGQNAGIGEVNALTVMNNAEREAYGYKLDAQSIRFGAQAESANAAYQAKVQRQNGLLTGLGTFATGVANYGNATNVFNSSSRTYQTPFGTRSFSTN